MKKALITALAITLQISCAIAGVPLRFDADVRSTSTFQASAYRGETLDIRARLLDGAHPLPVPAGAEAAMLWQTNGMGSAWWTAPASVTTSGVVSAVWSPTNDVGAAAYRLFLGVADGGANYRANMLLRMIDAPGASPNELAPPIQSIDFSLVEVANAPWLTVEADPAWSAWADANTNRLGYVSHVEEAETARFADYAEQAGSADEAQTAGTATYADSSAFATNAADAQHAWNAETASTLLVGLAARDGEFFTGRDGAVAQAATNYTDSATDKLRQSQLSRAEAEAGFTEWTFQNTPPGMTNCSLLWYAASQDWVFQYSLNGMHDYEFISGAETSTNLSLVYNATATRTRLRPTAAMEAAWDAKADGDTVTNIVRDLSLGGIWDEQIQVWWTPRMRNGSLTYEATTNVNLNAED